MEKHFKLTGEAIQWQGHTLHRIEATRTSCWARVGERGGFVEKMGNLSGEAWVDDEAKAWGFEPCLYDESMAMGNACVYGKASMWGRARISGGAHLYGGASMKDNARATDDAQIAGLMTDVYGRAHIGRGAVIARPNDYVLFQGFLNDAVTADRTQAGYVILFDSPHKADYYTADEFAPGIYRIFRDPVRMREAELLAELIRARFGEKGGEGHKPKERRERE